MGGGVVEHINKIFFDFQLNICDPILENHTSGHMQNLWEFSTENFSGFLKSIFFAYSDKATIKPSCCEISHP